MLDHHAPAAMIAADPTVQALADALHSERRLLVNLATILRRQREAVAQDDLASVDDSVFATQRVLLTLKEAHRRRGSLNRLLGERQDLPLDQLDGALGERMSPVLATARGELRAAALELAQEVDVNRRVLRLALADTEELVRALCGAPATPTYGADGAAEGEGRPTGRLLDRQG